MGAMNIGLVHPGEMGAAIGAALVLAGQQVSWASEGRSPATAARASAAGLDDTGSLSDLVAHSEMILSVCPPHAAVEVATKVVAAADHPDGWWYVDANAVAPTTARAVADVVAQAGARYVDGGIIGPPPVRPGRTRLYLSGADAVEASQTLASPLIEIHILSDNPTAASALKLAYASWSKGSSALLLVARAAAERSGVEAALVEEWRTSQPELIARWEGAVRSAADKGWRWSGEMDEIATMLESVGLPPGFHRAAAQVFDDPPTVA
jgi:3-hydroxyisobutyrate dehydrogenase-like beta-hydroxyacid dehydrogenase